MSTVAFHSGDPQTTRILHFAVGASGTAKPVSTIYSTYQSGGWDSTQLAVDSHRSIYLALSGHVRVYPNGTRPATDLYDGTALAIDSQDNIYVVALAHDKNAGHYEVNEYASGSTTPFRTIDGTGTEMQIGEGGLHPTIALVL
jgi:hypothetical protein